MRIALCLSGQPRGLETAYQYVKRNVLDINEHVDVFCSVVYDTTHLRKECYQTLVDVEEKIFSLYAPTEYNFDHYEPQHYEKYDGVTYVGDSIYPPHAAAMSFYSVYLANKAKREHEKKYGFTYDLVIRSRYDFAINTPIKFEHSYMVPQKSIVVPSEPHLNPLTRPKRDRCNDQFAFGTSCMMDRYCNTWMHLDEFKEQGIPFLGEDLLQANFVKEYLVGSLMYINMNPPFEPCAHNGTPHSLVRDDVEFWRGIYG